jgi:hypothetical protein
VVYVIVVPAAICDPDVTDWLATYPLLPEFAPEVVEPVLEPRTKPTAVKADEAAEVVSPTMLGTVTKLTLS